MSDIIIIIAHYNNPKGLLASLSSIRETFNIDIVIIDDGSKELFKETDVLKSYPNGNVFFIYEEENKGVGAVANKGLLFAQEKGYKFIARLDCGDFCYPNKFKKQLDYLKNNPDVKLVGTWAKVIDEKGNYLYDLKHPTQYEVIKKKMYLNSTFLNPSVLFYSDILKSVGNYPHKYRRAAQDYAFFFKVIKQYKAENLPELLMDYIIESHSISTQKRRVQVKHRMMIIMDNFYVGWYPIIGMLRSMVLYLFPRYILEKVKHWKQNLTNNP